MSDTLQYLVRNLLAAGGAPSENQKGTNLLYEEDGDLMEQLWTETGQESQRSVASDVKKNTPALYLVGEDKERLIFYLDQSSTINCVRYNDDEDEWEEWKINRAKDITVHSESRLGGCFTADGIAILFQNPAKQLGAIVKNGDVWKVTKPIPATLSIGTPLSVIDTEDEINLFYSGEDKSIHHQVISFDISAWEDHILEDSKFENPVTHLAVVDTGDQAKTPFEIYALTASTLVRVTMTGNKLELGRVEGKKFIPPNTAERTIVIQNNSGIINIGRSGGRSRIRRRHGRR